MSLFDEYKLLETRRQFFGRGKNVLGAAALTSLLGNSRIWAGEPAANSLGLPHFPPKVKNVIYLHMVGGPSQMDLFDYKPQMQ